MLEDSLSENIVAGVPHPRTSGNGTAVIVGVKVDQSAYSSTDDPTSSAALSSPSRSMPTFYSPRARVICRRHLCCGRHFITPNSLKCGPQTKPHVSHRSSFDSSLFSRFHVYRHEHFGGIHPYRAVQAHQRNMVRSRLSGLQCPGR